MAFHELSLPFPIVIHCPGETLLPPAQSVVSRRVAPPTEAAESRSDGAAGAGPHEAARVAAELRHPLSFPGRGHRQAVGLERDACLSPLLGRSSAAKTIP